MKNTALVIALSLSFGNAPLSADNSIYLGGSRQSEYRGDNWAIELGFHTFKSKYFIAQGSLMYFKQNRQFYEGGNASISISTGQPLSLYTGLGGFIGRHEECIDDARVKVCRDSFTAGMYPEAGLILTLNGAHIGAFARRYKTFDRGDNHFTMYGLKIGSSF